jgi:hypothetical protein
MINDFCKAQCAASFATHQLLVIFRILQVNVDLRPSTLRSGGCVEKKTNRPDQT